MNEEQNNKEKSPVTSSRLPETGNRVPETIEQPQTDNMEVHHHGHVHQQKKWKKYIFQFLMLFLAVFCGFLAENQREHIVEKHRAKENAKSLLDDLVGDTVKIHAAIQYAIWAVNRIDTLQRIADSITDYKSVPGRFYYYSSSATISPYLDWNKATLHQIINSGNIRYFKNNELIKKISDYDKITRVIDGQIDEDRIYRQKSKELRNEVLISRHFSVFSSTMYQQVPEYALKLAYPIQATSPEDWKIS